MPQSSSQTENSNSDHHRESVLKRLEEVASSEYPFPIPERVKLEKSQRIHLTSFRNIKPLLSSVGLFWLNIHCPLLTVVFMGLGWYWTSKVFVALAMVCLGKTLQDPFVVHFVTHGRYGGLGCGGRCKTTGLPNSTAREGFFCNARNDTNTRIKNRLGRFVHYVPTPYLFSGDLLTMWPFLVFKGSRGGRVAYKRYWVKVPAAPAPDGEHGPSKKAKAPSSSSKDNSNDDVDVEAVALDIVFPKEGHQADKPTFLILHGLNGGSTEPYVLDLARRATREGHTVAVMINRGLMKTPLRGYESFHGARTSDVGCAVDALHHALYGQKPTTTMNSNSKIVLVGFSMGAIIAANYAAKSTYHSGLAGALCFSGTLSSSKNLLDCPAGRHSASVWQPALAWALKGTIIKPNMAKFLAKGITVKDIEAVNSVNDIDTKLVCKYNGYKTVYDYYEDMSAGGSGDEKGLARLNGTKIPLLAVHAIDDPIAIFETMLEDEISKTDNVMLLATKHGGHIGWPTGLFPSKNRWNFMVDIAMEFASEVVVAAA
jgi:predicted alpha/beta-fold hydrolase